MGASAQAHSGRLYATTALVVVLLVYLLQSEDSLLRMAASSVILTLPSLKSSMGGSWISEAALRLAEQRDVDWDKEPGTTEAEQEEEEEAEEAETEAAVAAVVHEDSEEHCFTTLLAMPGESKRRTVAEALSQACECRSTGQSAPSHIVIPLIWWAGARMGAFSHWANGPRQFIDGEFRWDFGHIMERPAESYHDVFDARPSLAWDAGMLFTPSYFVSGRFIVNLTTADACRVILQPVTPVTNMNEAAVMWFERFAITGIRQHYPRPIDKPEEGEDPGGEEGSAEPDAQAAGSTGSSRSSTRVSEPEIGSLEWYYKHNIAVSATATGDELPSPFYSEAMYRAKEYSLPGTSLNRMNGGQELLPYINGRTGQWVSPHALELGMKGISNDLAVGTHTGARVHIHRPLSPIIVPRFYPDIFREMNLVRLMEMPPNSTAIRDWAFVPGVVHNVTQYLITYCGVYFRKYESAVIRLNRPGGDAKAEIEAVRKALEAQDLKGGSSSSDSRLSAPLQLGSGGTDAAGGAVDAAGGGGIIGGLSRAMAALIQAASPSPSPMPAPNSLEYAGWVEERVLTGVSVKSCKHMPTPSASRPPSPSPVAKADFALAMKVDEYLPIQHRWHSNVYHLYGETVTRALSVYPFVDHSRGYIAGDEGLVRGLRLLERWRVRDMTVDKDAPALVSAKALHLVDPMLCQMTSANELLMLREALRAAMKLPAPSLGYVRAPIIRDPAIITARLRRAGSNANLAETSAVAQSKYGCPAYVYRRPRVLVIRRRATRLFTNYHSLLNTLKASGAIITIFDEVALPPPLETFGLFARSDVIIGVHGAGLTNVIASSPGAAVFEILPSSFPGLHYAEYSIVMGLEYNRWEVPPMEPPEEDEFGRKRHNRTSTKDKDAHVTAPVTEIMTSLCDYISRRFGVTDADWAAAAAAAAAEEAAAREKAKAEAAASAVAAKSAASGGEDEAASGGGGSSSGGSAELDGGAAGAKGSSSSLVKNKKWMGATSGSVRRNGVSGGSGVAGRKPILGRAGAGVRSKWRSSSSGAASEESSARSRRGSGRRPLRRRRRRSRRGRSA